MLRRLTGAHELPQAGSPLTGGEFFAEPQRGVALCGARERALTPRGRISGMDTKVSTLLNPVSFWDGTAKFSELRL